MFPGVRVQGAATVAVETGHRNAPDHAGKSMRNGYPRVSMGSCGTNPWRRNFLLVIESGGLSSRRSRQTRRSARGRLPERLVVPEE
jgi:hypothetical protein